MFGSQRPEDHRNDSRGRGPPGHQPDVPIGSITRDLMEGLHASETLRTIPQPEIDLDDPEVAITNVQLLASYSWVDTAHPTILVPGSPRRWSPPPLPVRLHKTRGASFIDSNGHRLGAHALVPLFEAVDATAGAALEWGTVDFVLDRNTLRKLACAADPARRDAFRIDVALAGGYTLLLRRFERRTVEHSWNFGDAYERAFSSAARGCERATLAGHFRVICFNRSGLKIVLRCEADAYDEPEAEGADELSSLMDALKLAGPVRSKSGLLSIHRAGKTVPQSSLVKLKMRSASRHTTARTFNLDTYLQLYFGQLPTLRVGLHDGRGKVVAVDEQRLDSDAYAAEAAAAKDSLKRLWRLLDSIVQVVTVEGRDRKLSLVYDSSSGLKLMERDQSDEPFLPPCFLDRFEF